MSTSSSPAAPVKDLTTEARAANFLEKALATSFNDKPCDSNPFTVVTCFFLVRSFFVMTTSAFFPLPPAEEEDLEDDSAADALAAAAASVSLTVSPSLVVKTFLAKFTDFRSAALLFRRSSSPPPSSPSSASGSPSSSSPPPESSSLSPSSSSFLFLLAAPPFFLGEPLFLVGDEPEAFFDPDGLAPGSGGADDDDDAEGVAGAAVTEAGDGSLEELFDDAEAAASDFESDD